MKLGLLAYSTNTGLGIQTYNFYKYMKPFRTMLVDISRLNHVETHHERYPGVFMITRGIPTNEEIDRFLDGLDVVFVVETPLNYYLFERAEQLGIKTVLQYNWEFLDYLQDPSKPKPTLFAAPSTWHFEELPYENKRLLPVPVDREVLKFRKIKEFKHFLHIAGRPAVHDRNGTTDTLFAFHMLQEKDVTLTVRIQDKEDAKIFRDQFKNDERIFIDDSDLLNYWEAYDGFDALIIPRKYGGLCLPMQEALACGMPVIMTDVSPNNDVLPSEWLVQADRTGEFMTRSMIDIHTVNQGILTHRIREFIYAGKSEVELVGIGPDSVEADGSRKISRSTAAEHWNEVANSIAIFLDWESMKHRYSMLFDELLSTKVVQEANPTPLSAETSGGVVNDAQI